MQRLILLNLDPPLHTKLRGIVSRGFTPRAIGRLREALTARAERIVQTALAEGTGDFVTDVAAELPLQAIAELLGIPQQDRGKIFAWSNEMIGYDDPEYGGDSQAAAAELVGYAMVMAEDRRACPRDDIVTKLVNAAGRRRPALGGRVRLLRDPAVRGGQRDHPQRDLARDAGLPGPPGPVGAVPGGAAGDRGR